MDGLVEQTRRALSGRVKKVIEDPTLASAAVLLLVYPKAGVTCTLLNRRSELVTDHKREIALPGGRRESFDETAGDTALRETHEEMGVLPKDVEILGELDDTTTNTNYVISPVVGTIPESYPFKPNLLEVIDIIEIPLVELTHPKAFRHDARIYKGNVIVEPSYAYNGNLVYGATANILSQLLELIAPSQEKESS